MVSSPLLLFLSSALYGIANAVLLHGNVTTGVLGEMDFAVEIDSERNLVDIFLRGPDVTDTAVWFAVGFNATVMCDTYGIVMSGDTTVGERILGCRSATQTGAGEGVAHTMTVISDGFENHRRVAHLQRARVGVNDLHWTFPDYAVELPVIWSRSRITSTFGFNGGHGGADRGSMMLRLIETTTTTTTSGDILIEETSAHAYDECREADSYTFTPCEYVVLLSYNLSFAYDVNITDANQTEVELVIVDTLEQVLLDIVPDRSNLDMEVSLSASHGNGAIAMQTYIGSGSGVYSQLVSMYKTGDIASQFETQLTSNILEEFGGNTSFAVARDESTSSLLLIRPLTSPFTTSTVGSTGEAKGDEESQFDPVGTFAKMSELDFGAMTLWDWLLIGAMLVLLLCGCLCCCWCAMRYKRKQAIPQSALNAKTGRSRPVSKFDKQQTFARKRASQKLNFKPYLNEPELDGDGPTRATMELQQPRTSGANFRRNTAQNRFMAALSSSTKKENQPMNVLVEEIDLDESDEEEDAHANGNAAVNTNLMRKPMPDPRRQPSEMSTHSFGASTHEDNGYNMRSVVPQPQHQYNSNSNGASAMKPPHPRPHPPPPQFTGFQAQPNTQTTAANAGRSNVHAEEDLEDDDDDYYETEEEADDAGYDDIYGSSGQPNSGGAPAAAYMAYPPSVPQYNAYSNANKAAPKPPPPRSGFGGHNNQKRPPPPRW